ncbi:relaxin receptor 1 isoform X2 [Anabrus simplex]|uniref:relaxin receptor 1 isoform X2 n=1 Tax=Anabrus simplex TaxID=316456 RepID=UPI0035A3C32D
MQCKRSVVCGLAVVTGAVLITALFFILRHGPCDEAMFRCGNSTVCIPKKFVCNDHKDCPGGEDENAYTCTDFHGKGYFNRLLMVSSPGLKPNFNDCGLTGVPLGCTCRNLTWLYCKNLGLTEVPQDVSTNVTRIDLSQNYLHWVHPDTLLGLYSLDWLFIADNQLQVFPLQGLRELTSLSWLDFSTNNLTLDGEIFPYLPNLKVLWLGCNSLTRLDKNLLRGLPGLDHLKLQRNKISWVDEDAFEMQKSLAELDLSNNLLHALPETVFEPLESLSNLMLAWNPFDMVSSELLAPVANLSSLDLQGVHLDNLDVEIFNRLRRLEFVYLTTFYYCTYAAHARTCKPNTDGVSSSDHLLARPILRAMVWLIGSLTCLGNALVLWGRFSERDENRELSFIVRNLAVADLLMGIYLIVIGVQDTQFRGEYSRRAHHWMSSWACTIIGMLAMASSEVSVLILVFLSLERFLLIAVPFGGHQKLTMKIAYRSVSLIWLTGLCFAAIPAVHWRHSTRFYGTNGMCFPLHIDDPFLLGWQYSAFVVLGVNTTALVLIALLYTGMFVSIWRTRHATPISSVKDIEFIVRFFFIILTDAMCWAPIIALKLLAMGRVHISDELYAWVVVFILPVNSAINPLLYTFTTPRYRSQLGQAWIRRFGWSTGLARMGHSQSTQSSLMPRIVSTVESFSNYEDETAYSGTETELR